MPTCLRITVLLTILQCALAGLAFSAPTELRCLSVPVVFSCDSPDDIKCLCDTSTAAVDFLGSLGLLATDVITILVVPDIPPRQGKKLLGSYDPTSKEVLIVDYEKTATLSQEGLKIFGQEINEELWCSFAAHELAHAISLEHLGPHVKTHTGAEYIAGVTQLAVLSPATRETILQRYADVEPYHSRTEMSELYFLFDPSRFAVKSYLHFISLAEPEEFVRSLIKEGNGR